MRPVDLPASIGKSSEIAAQQRLGNEVLEETRRDRDRQVRRTQQVRRKAAASEVTAPLVTYDRKGKRRHQPEGEDLDERR